MLKWLRMDDDVVASPVHGKQDIALLPNLDCLD